MLYTAVLIFLLLETMNTPWPKGTFLSTQRRHKQTAPSLQSLGPHPPTSSYEERSVPANPNIWKKLEGLGGRFLKEEPRRPALV